MAKHDKCLNAGSFSNEPGGRKPLGRPKGKLNKTTATLRSAIMDCFNELQQDPFHNLFEWACREPTEFYKIASKLIPTEIQATVREVITVKLVDDESEEEQEDDYVEFEEVTEDDDDLI